MRIDYKSKYLGRTVSAERVGKALVVDREYNQIYLSWTGYPLINVNFENFKLAKQVANLMITTFGEHLMYLGHESWLVDLGQITNDQTDRLVMATTLELLEKEEVANEATIQKCIKIAREKASLLKYRKD